MSGLGLLAAERALGMRSGQDKSRTLRVSSELRLSISQTRSSVRLTIRHRTGNQGFAEDLTKWVFQESGVLKVVGSTHWSESGAGEVEKAEYRKNEQVVSLRLGPVVSGIRRGMQRGGEDKIDAEV
jgi:hypothetical protein